MPRYLTWATAVLAAVLAAYAAHRALFRQEPAADDGVRPNVVFLTVDTLRADRLGRGITPALDALAASGARFVNARATVPLTLPSHVSIMTGTLPPRHGVRDNGVVFRGGVPPIARTLRQAGYRTGAFVGAYVLDRRFGLADGFDTYDDRVPRNPAQMGRLEAERRGQDVVEAASSWLDEVQTPFFLWVHLYDPHAPYEAPQEFLAKGGNSPYDAEVAYADAQIARLLQRLRDRGFVGSTIVAAMGDHGEGLGEHGERTHGMLAYDSTLRVPLILAGPGIAAGEVTRPVSLADVAPTVLRRVGIHVQGEAGNSPGLFEPAAEEGDVYSETEYPRTAGWHPVAALAGERWKLLLSSEPELYDLSADAGEVHNVAADHPGIVQGMSARLKQLQDTTPAQPSNAGASAEASERLRALGYVSGAPRAGAEPGAINPARVIAAWNAFEQALTELNNGRALEASAALRDLASKFPGSPVFQSTYARALGESGRWGAALEVYRAAVARWPDHATLFHDLAVAARAAGRLDEAMKAEQAALALEADNPQALNGLGLLHVDAGRPAEAVPLFERAANADPSNASYWTNLGNARRAAGDAAAAGAAYRRALAVDASYPDAANGIGVLHVQSGRAGEAIAWFEQALRAAPDFHEARLNLGIAYQENGQPDKAAAIYRDLLARAPSSAARERQAARELLKSIESRIPRR